MPRKTTSSQRIPRPPNAFILYRSHMTTQLPPPPPGTYRKQGEISQMISELWRNESREVKAQYQQLALVKKVEHEARYPGYKYSPRNKEQRERERETRSKLKDRERKHNSNARARHIESQDTFSATGSVHEAMYTSSTTGKSSTDEAHSAWSQQEIEETFRALYDNLGNGSNYNVQSGACYYATGYTGPDGIQQVGSEGLIDQSHGDAHASLRWASDNYVPEGYETSFESMTREFTWE
ncbi:hypothetical protein C0995_001774 [Termitomyces sp. Mi166|nr:hypothetical protein C0995_001774 [Termitomyces sp. Mi166\